MSDEWRNESLNVALEAVKESGREEIRERLSRATARIDKTAKALDAQPSRADAAEALRLTLRIIGEELSQP